MAGMNRHIWAFVWLGVIGLSCSVCWTESHAAEHGQIHYDPSKCSKDAQGMVYFAVGRRVFRQPMDNIVYITTDLPEMQATYPAPPDPSQPVGCPDHPIPGGSYNLARMSAMPDTPPNADSAYADHIGIIINDGRTGGSDEEGLFDLLSTHAVINDDSVPGFMGSGKNPQRTNFWAYKALDYLTPGGNKLTISCRDQPWSRRNNFVTCNYGYMVTSDLAITVGFPTAVVPLDKIINADQELRRRIDAAQMRFFLRPVSNTKK